MHAPVTFTCGINPAAEHIKVEFRNEHGALDFETAALHVDGKIRLDETIFADAFRFLQRTVTTAVPKLTIPSPNMAHYRGGPASISPEVYPDAEEF